MKKIRFGLIGCGKITQSHHAPNIIALGKKAEITALYDLKKGSAEKLKKQSSLKCEIYDSVDELLKSNVDAVVISTPNNSHFELTMKALAAGKHVLVEKPMAVNLKEADAMIAVAAKKDLHLQVNQSLRFAPAYTTIKKLIDKGTIGNPLHIRCIRAGSSSPDKSWSPGAKWFISKAFCGGIVMDIAVHMADMMAWYFGDVESVFSINKILSPESEVTDNVSAVMNFKNGASGVLELSWTLPSGAAFLEIYGDKGTIRLGFEKDGNIEIFDKGKFKKAKVLKTKNSHQCFIDGISGKADAPSPTEIGRKALALCLAIIESGEKQKPVSPKI